MELTNEKKLMGPQMAQFLLEVGLVGIEKGLFTETKAIFETVVKFFPNDLNAKLIQAVGHVFMGELKEGGEKLFAILRKDPKNDKAKSYLALALKMGHADNQAEGLIRHLLEGTKDEDVRALAEGLLKTCVSEIKPQVLNAEQAAKVGNGSYVY